MIKAAVSRQREFLADASAVQFTRNPLGIAGALKKIGGFVRGAVVKNPNAPEVSHMFFGHATSGLTSMFATHPPLSERIARLDPAWDGAFVESHLPPKSGRLPRPASPESRRPPSRSWRRPRPARVHSSRLAVADIGQPSPMHLLYAAQLVKQIPDALIRDRYTRPIVHERLCTPC